MSTEHLPSQGSTSVPNNQPVQDVVPTAPPSSGDGVPPALSEAVPSNETVPETAPEVAPPRVRMNPTADPAHFKAVPSLNPGESPRVDMDAIVEEQVAREQKAKAEAPVQRAEPVEIPRTEALEGDLEAELAAVMQSGEVASGIAAVAPLPHAGADSSEIGLVQGTKVSGIIQSANGARPSSTAMNAAGGYFSGGSNDTAANQTTGPFSLYGDAQWFARVLCPECQPLEATRDAHE